MTLFEKLELIKKKAEGIEKTDINMGETLVKYIARESVQTYDYGLSYSGLSKSLQAIVETTRWQKTLSDIGYGLSLTGDNYGLVLELIDGKPFIDGGEITEYTRIGDKVTRAAINANEFVEINGKKEPLYSIFEVNKDGTISKVKAYIADKKWVYQEKTRITIPFKQIPVVKLQNNVLGIPDVPEDLAMLVDKLNWLSDDLVAEWVASSTQWLKNMTFGSTETADDVFQNSLQHKKIHEGNDPDNKASMGLGPVSLGTQSVVTLSALINFMEDKILKYSMQFREVGAGGNNKHNLEIATQNKQAFEYMLAKLDWRQRQLSEGLTYLQSLIADQVEGDSADTISVTISVPELEQFKVENMQAEVAFIEAQTENQLGQAKSWEAQAELTDKTDPNAKQTNQMNNNGGE